MPRFLAFIYPPGTSDIPNGTFACEAETSDHAAKQAASDYPNGTLIWIVPRRHARNYLIGPVPGKTNAPEAPTPRERIEAAAGAGDERALDQQMRDDEEAGRG